MSGYSLEIWLAQQLRDIDEDGTCCSRIQLRSVENGTPWQTWSIMRSGEHRTELAPLLQEIQDVMSGLAEQFPVGKTQIVFIALDGHGSDLARFPHFVLGKNRAASAGNLIQNEAGQAMSQTMLAFADTFRQILAPINAQFQLNMKHIEALQTTVIGQNAYITALQEQKLIQKQAEAEAEKDDKNEIAEMLAPYLPAIVEMLTTKSGGSVVAQKITAAAVQQVAAPMVNGASAPGKD